MDTIRVFFKLLKIALKSMIQYPADFGFGVLGLIAQNGVNLLAISVILGRFYDLAGWTIWEIVFLYGFWITGASLYGLVFMHVYALEEYLVQGSFDVFLIRPVSPFLMLITAEVNVNGAADILFGVACLALSMTHLALHFSLLQWAFAIVMMLSATVVQLGINLALSSLAFWTTRSAGLVFAANQVSWNMTQQYPLEMFGRGFRILVTCILPVAFLNYYPTRWLLGKTVPGDPDYFLSFLGPLVALALLGIAALVWSSGIRHYKSTGN